MDFEQTRSQTLDLKSSLKLGRKWPSMAEIDILLKIKLFLAVLGIAFSQSNRWSVKQKAYFVWYTEPSIITNHCEIKFVRPNHWFSLFKCPINPLKSLILLFIIYSRISKRIIKIETYLCDTFDHCWFVISNINNIEACRTSSLWLKMLTWMVTYYDALILMIQFFYIY